MKKQTLPLLVLTAVMVFFVSCKKESIQNETTSSVQVIAVKISPNQSYQVNMPDAGNLNISTQANHFLVSEAHMDTESGQAVYKYIPATDFTGTDEVMLSSTKTITTYATGSGCSNPSNNTGGSVTTTQYTRVKFTIAQ